MSTFKSKEGPIRSSGGVLWIGLKKSLPLIMSLFGSKPVNRLVGCGVVLTKLCVVLGTPVVLIPAEDGVDDGDMCVSDALWLGGVS